MTNAETGLKKPLTLRILLAVLGLFVLLFFWGLVNTTGSVTVSLKIVLIILAALVGQATIFFFTVIVHELGHYLAGRVFGYRFYGVRLFALEYSRLSTGPKFRKIKHGGAAGAILMAPADLNGILLKRRLFVLAGPVASLILGGLAYLAFQRSGGSIDFNQPVGQFVIGQVFLWMSAFSLFFGASSLLYVFQVKNRLASDGRHLYLSFAKPARYEWDVVFSMIILRWTYGGRARDWDVGAIDYLREKASEPKLSAVANAIAYHNLVDRGEISEAVERIRDAARFADEVGEEEQAVLKELRVEAAYAFAYYLNQPVEARALLEKSGASKKEEYSSFERAEAAILFAEGDEAGAKAAAQEAEVRLRAKYPEPMPDNIVLELELIRQVVERPRPLPTVG